MTLADKGVSFNWVKAYSNCFQKELAQPIANVFLKTISGEWQEFFPLVDSGALVTIFNKSDCCILGYELEKGKKCELNSANGQPIICYIHTVEMKIGEEVIQARVAFSEGDNMGKGFLGRVDVFDTFKVAFRGKITSTHFTKDV